VLLALLFPPYDFPFLAPVALAPLLYALKRESLWWRRMMIGEIAGTTYWLLHCYWINYVLSTHGGLDGPVGWFTMVLFAFLKGLHMALFATLAGRLMEARWAILTVPALWVGLERTHGELGFQWLLLGNAGIDMSLPLRLAPLMGVYGVSFVFAMLGTAVALVAWRRPRIELAPLAVLLLLFVAPALPTGAPPKQQVAVLQPNVPQDARWDDPSIARLIERVFKGTLAEAIDPAKPKPDLILWSESPAPFFFESDPGFTDAARRLARATRTPFLFGAVAYSPQQDQLNAAIMLNPAGEEISRYAKMYLVPFGEFVPPIFFWVNKITKEVGTSVPGTRILVPPVDGHGVGGFICYESAFPELVRRFADQGGELLVNLTNDGYFGRTGARLQHLLLARMRAVENGRWLLRPTNDGFTVAIDPTGQIRQQLPPFEMATGRLNFNWISTKTPYTRYGDWFPWLCLIIGLAASLDMYRHLSKTAEYGSARSLPGLASSSRSQDPRA
jgi:apolipoprotein N-acyltransferase